MCQLVFCGKRRSGRGLHKQMPDAQVDREFIPSYTKFPEIPIYSHWGQVIQVVILGTLILVWWTPSLKLVRVPLTSLLSLSAHFYSIPTWTCVGSLPQSVLYTFPKPSATCRTSSCPSNSPLMWVNCVPGHSWWSWHPRSLFDHIPVVEMGGCRGNNCCPCGQVVVYGYSPWWITSWSGCSWQGWCKGFLLKDALDNVRAKFVYGVMKLLCILIPLKGISVNNALIDVLL